MFVGIGLREAEVEDLDVSVWGDLDVGRLEIAVDDPRLVCLFQRSCDLPRNADCLVDRDWAAEESLSQVLSGNELHRQKVDRRAVRLCGALEAEHLRDVRMVQRRQQTRLAFESRKAFRTAGHFLRQHFDRNITIEPGVGGPVYLSHAALAERRLDSENTELDALRERHGSS